MNQDEKNRGLYGKYIISKANGDPVDDGARYFVLRYDFGGDDHIHIRACRKALKVYADEIQNHLPHLAADLKADLIKYRERKQDYTDVQKCLIRNMPPYQNELWQFEEKICEIMELWADEKARKGTKE